MTECYECSKLAELLAENSQLRVIVNRLGIVSCRDCAYCTVFKSGELACDLFGARFGADEAEGFCSFGKRRETTSNVER